MEMSVEIENKSEVYRRVRERLEHVELIFDLRHHYCDINYIQNIGSNGWTHPWRYFDALMYYLLITCFDMLGQSSEWVDFSKWLESKKKKAERQEAMATLQSDVDPLTITKHFNKKYQSIYGVRTSFHRFVSEVLTQDERAELYSSIQIVRGVKDGEPNTSYPALGYIVDEGEKLEFLFNLRNRFTHAAVTMGSPVAGVYREAYDPFEIGGTLLKGHVEIHREERKGEWVIYQVRDWPYLLQRLVTSALTRCGG
jgi:hypothetical protein